ncbi:Presenilins-associated rhomboid-like protein, mitochondrial [Aphelenchoides bicaudatus]|nr:Presenilins-associated rhomboid-like protein, mitochondrial [Aphelenchoides bicaudatus]
MFRTSWLLLRAQRTPLSSQNPSFSPQRLLKATLFTAGVGCTTYTVAAVLEHNRVKKIKRDAQRFFSDFSANGVFGKMQRMDHHRPQLSNGQKTALAFIGVNTLVFLAWRIPKLQATMYRYFTNSLISRSLCAPMVLSVFSHNNFVHLALNMYVLYSFCPVSIDRFLGVEQFVALYLTAGAVSSLTSLVQKFATRSNLRALGASGAICTLLAYTCMKIPDARLSIIFLPFFQFSAQQAIYGLIAFDLLGLIFRFRMFDHAAHLGGTLFGVWYAAYGEHMVRHRFNPLIHKIQHKFEEGQQMYEYLDR